MKQKLCFPGKDNRISFFSFSKIKNLTVNCILRIIIDPSEDRALREEARNFEGLKTKIVAKFKETMFP